MLDKFFNTIKATAGVAVSVSVAAFVIDFCVTRILDRHGIKILKLNGKGKKPASAKKKPTEPKQA